MASRGYTSPAEVDAAVISACNAIVSPSDSLYLLGNFSGLMHETAKGFRGLVNCRNVHLIFGYQDRRSYRPYFNVSATEYVFTCKKLELVLSHWPMIYWFRQRAGAVHLFGHDNGYVDGMYRLLPPRLAFDVGL